MALFGARKNPRPVAVLRANIHGDSWAECPSARAAFARVLAVGALLGTTLVGQTHPQARDLGQDLGGHGLHNHRAQFVAAAVAAPPPVSRVGWTVVADSQQIVDGNYAAANVLDGDPGTFWHTTFINETDPLPHTLTIDTHTSQRLSGLTYLPRPASNPNGRIGQYRVEVSTDGTTWTAPVATGTLADDATLKTMVFATVMARYVRLTALTEAGNRGPWSSASEINLLGGIDPTLARTGWTVRADSQETVAANYAAMNVLDGNTGTMWHTGYSNGAAALPHVLTVDMHATNLVSGLSYLGRQDGSRHGNIGQYRVETSIDATTWGAPAATGLFADINSAQTVTFPPAIARYVRLTALTEAGARGPWSSAAEINLLGWADPRLPRAAWTVNADSQETASGNYAAANVRDGDPTTFWHTTFTNGADPLPHTLTIDTHTSQQLSGLSYLPRPPSNPNGRIGRYRVEVSTDATTWITVVASATFPDDAALKTVTFPATTGRYLRLIASTEAGNRGPWSSAAEINLLGATDQPASSKGTWAAPIGFPLVPVAAAVLPNGKILTWSSYLPDSFGGTGMTVTATLDPATGVVTQRTVSETGHDMFCPGISVLPDGRIIVTGGDDSANTSIYDPATDAWTTGPLLNIPRGYQSSLTLSDGRVFVLGGSWNGGTYSRNGEVWEPVTGWRLLPGAPVAPILTHDAQGVFRADNHAWLFAWSGGLVLQAGPSKAMNWYSTTGGGSTTPAGTRGQDGDAMNGNAVMFDAGKILTVGGAPSYQNSSATTNAYVMSLIGTTVNVHQVAPMANARSFANSVVLPDGKVAVFGGENFALPFSDNSAVLTPELWDPTTETFSSLSPALVPRTYHSVALLMPDGRVFTGGGGLCGTGCPANHFDAEIFTPPYLLNADGSLARRPTITAAPGHAAHSETITVTTDRPVTGFSIVRFGSATHSVDTDQRRIALTPTAVTAGYSLTIPADPGIAVPGEYMLFALDSRGVPSIATALMIG
jgi:galactose oxidase